MIILRNILCAIFPLAVWKPATLILGMFFFLASAVLAGPNRVSVTFIPEVAGINAVDNQTGAFWLGVEMKIEDGWHIYWRNPGDSGLPTTIRWNEHAFLKPGEIHWPRPFRFDEDGITTYGYSDSVVLLVPVRVSRDEINTLFHSSGGNGNIGQGGSGGTRKNPEHALSAQINWLVCKDICIPESTQLSLHLDGKGDFPGYSESGSERIDRSRRLLPESVTAWQAHGEMDSDRFKVIVTPETGEALFPDADDIYFYPHLQGIIEHTAPQTVVSDGDRLILEMQVSRYLRSRPDELTGVLSAGQSWVRDRNVPAIEISMPVSAPTDTN